MIHPSLFSSATRSQIVDDDISVRESLELLIRSAGSEAETYASAEKFLARPEV
jgi:FixJ family two-component response regulator